MPLSRSRDYLSIGEVLDSLREEFPDISISKIRFLESEGLIAPRRTDSKYRMFYESDVSRLRYILSMQRDHFLPLKVIKERIAEAESNGGVMIQPPPPQPEAPEPVQTTSTTTTTTTSTATGVQLTREELCTAAGLSAAELAGLEEFQILERDRTSFDENDLLIAKAARRFFDYGIEPRHLKMYRQFAEREVAFFGQIVQPMTRRRDPSAPEETARSLNELARLSRQMREASLQSSLRELL
jgi:DNA-binding transcriptional MerR regulator